MPIGTGDGKTFDDEWGWVTNQLASAKSIPITGENNQTSEQPQSRSFMDAITGNDGKPRYQFWPERMARGLVDAFKLPGDVAAGKIDPMSDEGIGRSFELASALVGGPAPIASKIVDGTLGVMGGVGARTAMKDDFKLAEEMYKKDFTPEQIYDSTKLYRGLEGKWRMEIPDAKAKFTQSFADEAHQFLEGASVKTRDYKMYNLEDVLDHPELYKAYPDLRTIKFHMDNQLASMGAAFHFPGIEKSSEISMNLPKILESKSGVHPLEVVMHEIQHVIQRKEGFNQGTNPNKALNDALSFLIDRIHSSSSGEEVERLKNIYNILIGDPKTSLGNSVSKVLYYRRPGEMEARDIERRLKEPNTPLPEFLKSGWNNPLPMPGEYKP